MALGFGGPPRDDLASWLGLFHPAYVKYVLAIGIIGAIAGIFNFVEMHVLTMLIGSLGAAADSLAKTSGFVESLVGVALKLSGLSPSLTILAIYGLVLIALSIVGVIGQALISRLELATINDIEREVLRNLLRKDDRFFQDHSTSVVTSRLVEDSKMIVERRRNLAEIWIASVKLAAMFYFFLQMNWILACVGFFVLVFGSAIVNFMMRQIQQMQGLLRGRDDTVKAALEDYLSTAPEIQVANIYDKAIGAFDDVQSTRRSIWNRFIFQNAKVGFGYGLSYVATFFAFVITIIVLIQNAGSAGSVIQLIPVLLKKLPEARDSISEIASNLLRMNIAYESVKRLLEYASRPIRGPRPAPGDAPAEQAAAVAPQPLELQGVTYRFTPLGPLQGGTDGINVTVNPNSLVAVVGGSGSGKTMLTQLMLGRLPAESGAVLLGGRPMPQIPPDDRAAMFAYMPQANALLDASIKENLLFTQRDDDAADADFTPGQMDLLARTGIAQVALEKALEMFPDKDLEERISHSDLSDLRTRLQERVAKDTGVELVRLGPGHAAPSHSIMDHILGGATDREFVLGLSESKQARQVIFKLSETPFGTALIRLALNIIESTKELLTSCEDVEAYNRIAPFPLEETIWEMRGNFVDMPASVLDAPAQETSALRGLLGGGGGNSPRLALLVLGLLSCPNEFDARWSPSTPTDALPSPDDDFAASLQSLLAEASDPFQPDHLNHRLCWRDNLLFAAPATSNSRLQSEINTILLDEIAGTPLNEMLTRSGFTYRVGRQGKKLSGGQRQRISLGRNLLRNVGIFVLDEPTSALDPRGRRQLNEYLKELAATRTIIAITHDRDLAQIADQVLMVHDGRLHAVGSYESLLENNEEFRRVIG